MCHFIYIIYKYTYTFFFFSSDFATLQIISAPCVYIHSVFRNTGVHVFCPLSSGVAIGTYLVKCEVTFCFKPLAQPNQFSLLLSDYFLNLNLYRSCLESLVIFFFIIVMFDALFWASFHYKLSEREWESERAWHNTL